MSEGNKMGRTPLNAPETKFELGEIVVTPTAAQAIELLGSSLTELLERHQAGDWGNVSDQVRTVNDRGVAERFSLQSMYELPTGERLVVVTTADRSLTTVHLDPQSI